MLFLPGSDLKGSYKHLYQPIHTYIYIYIYRQSKPRVRPPNLHESDRPIARGVGGCKALKHLKFCGSRMSEEVGFWVRGLGFNFDGFGFGFWFRGFWGGRA